MSPEFPIRSFRSWILLMLVSAILLPAGLAVADKAKEDSAVAEKAVEDSTQEDEAEATSEADTDKGKTADQSRQEKKKSAKQDQKESTPAARKKRSKVRLALIDISSALPESPGQMGPFGDLQMDLGKLVSRLDKAAGDKSVQGVVLRLRNPVVGRGQITEIRQAIERIRQNDKKVYADLEVAMATDYLIAGACDEIVMPESGYLVIPGVRAETMFYKGLLGKLGIEADFMHIGAYKGAAESMTRKRLSGPVRENLTSVIDDIYDQMLTTIAADRLMTVDQVRAAIDVGLLTAGRAHELGLVDRLAYPDQLRTQLTDSHEADPLVLVKNYGKKKVDTDFSGPMGFVKLLQMMMGLDSGSGRSNRPQIAVVYAVGPIMTGKSQNSPLAGQVMGSTTIIEALREAADDKKVSAIVLRINSPGGSAVASDLIWRETRRIEKPIVVSMGDVAGSGGYYIAMGADKIFAAPWTITGSIGVVSGKLAVKGMYDKIGITTDVIHRGQNSGIFSGSGKFSESERVAMASLMDDIYGQFTAKAAQGRDMPLEDLEALAGGRIYTGRQAKKNGLVDELGSLDDAIDAAKQLAGLESDDKVKLKLLPQPKNFFESLFGDLDAEKEVRLTAGIEQLAPELVRPLRKGAMLRQLFREPAVVVMPFDLQIH